MGNIIMKNKKNFENEKGKDETEMRMLKRIKGVTLEDKIKSEDIRKELAVGSIKKQSKGGQAQMVWVCAP